jgi:hypothetical protein
MAGAPPSYHVLGDEPGAWPAILESAGLRPLRGGAANLVVLRRGSDQNALAWRSRVEQGMVLVLEGDSPVAAAFGFRPTEKHVYVQSVRDRHDEELSIVWEQQLDLRVHEVPAGATVFTAERWEQAPLLAGLRIGSGAVLWLAVSPGERGYERFPYLMQALADLGLQPPFHSQRLWAFFDSSYRLRVDLDYFAQRWRRSGVGALHVAAWHFHDGDPQRAAYVKQLIEACHRQSILVYAWLELPHVSEKFWTDHPEWREKTALGQDAQLDWRKLMNLTNRDAFAAAAAGVRSLLTAYDWDGVNLAELYFESLEGDSNPARFTPLNDDVRREFQQRHGYDPALLFGKTPDPARRQAFLDYRAELAARQQAEWLGEIEKIRRQKPHLDLVLTHIDDQFDPRMRELLGADTSRTLPLIDRHQFTFLIEDPATAWHEGPQRYPKIAAKYQPLTSRQEKLAIDINIVERYQDVYPTKRQTGVELLQLVHQSTLAFPRVALYFENSIRPVDLPFLPSAAAGVTYSEQNGSQLVLESRAGFGLPWREAALVDGKPWPFRDDETLWLPPGKHTVQPAPRDVLPRIRRFTGDLKTVTVGTNLAEWTYESSARCFLELEKAPQFVEVDGEPVAGRGLQWILPRGQHLVTIQY